ncbi:DUF2961 domain-containing protein [soil metagenome]
MREMTFAFAPAPITVESILREMTDLRVLAQRPDPWYRYRQWTSYDRNSDGWKDPFANGDAGQFLRDETNNGRTERVMADAKGPGALVRLWSANPAGTIRFYFDGEKTARLTTDMRDLLTGKNPLFPDPFSYLASQGANLYFPMPFAKSLKITWEGDGKPYGLYYAAGIREYAPGTKTTTFAPSAMPQWKATMDRTGKALLNPPTQASAPKGGTIAPGGTLEAKYTSGLGGELRDLTVVFGNADAKEKAWEDPARTHNLLRKLRLRMSFDGETTVDTPLGDFFGSAVGVTPFESLPISVRKDGTMIARWSMPFRKDARIWIDNGNELPVQVKMSATQAYRPFTPATYTFHARWRAQTRRTRPMYDFTYADLKGEGRFVGASLVVSNPAPAWWGEGDEKVYVDGETFPSLFGTGTEDYFGYAWSDPTPFTRPYHAQPPTPNHGNLGQTENARYHIIDDIPYRTGLKFDMEAWHWADTMATYATTAYWYASPGTTLPQPANPATLLIPDAPLPAPVKDAIEGERLAWHVSNGETEMQEGFMQLSGQTQFWWHQPKVGATAEVKIPVPSAGSYELVANLGHAADYGRFRVTVNGQPAKEIDFYQPALEWKHTSLGTFDLPAGEATIRFEVLKANPASAPGANMLGVDYFLLKKATTL